MANVPGAAAVAKAPPAGVRQRVQFENLAGSSDDTTSPSAANSSPDTEPAYQDAIVWITSAEQNSSGEQSNALPSNQQPPPQPAQEETHHTVRPVSSTGRPAANPEPRSPWADIREEPNAPTAQQPTGDVRRRVATAQRPQQNIWTSSRFHTAVSTEEEYLKQWLLALQDQDWSIQARWRDYCVERGDGTYNPLAHAPGFIRRFIFLYGSQPPHFWTQHQTIGLLSALEERRILEQFEAQYEATHRHREPPVLSWFWPPRPGAPAESIPPRVVVAPRYQAQPAMPHTVQHQAQPDRWLSQYTMPPGWGQPDVRAWNTPHHNAAPSWEGQEWYNAQRWSWWPDQWSSRWSNVNGWSGRWVWD